MRILLVSCAIGVAACGGGGGGEPLIAGAPTGTYAGDPFTMTVGFATIYEDVPVIGLGDGNLDCGSPDDNSPPSGTSAVLELPSLDVGSYANVFVNLFHNVGEFTGAGANSGSVTITASSSASVAGMVSFSYTDDAQLTYALDGTFEVARCP